MLGKDLLQFITDKVLISPNRFFFLIYTSKKKKKPEKWAKHTNTVY